jgi:sterol desaturase/sphingolipid hydroxylase (fatty acid hydroxylase superfamily)
MGAIEAAADQYLPGFLGFSLFISLRYLLLAGLLGICCRGYLLLRRPGCWHDIRLSLAATLPFALAASLVQVASRAGHTALYWQVASRGWVYLLFSYLLVLVLQDGFFYFSHRLLHQRRFFSWCHSGHHHSRQPSVWTSFAFDWPEACLHALFLVAIICWLPLHVSVLLAVLSTMSVWAVVNHLNVSLPEWLLIRWGGLGHWLIGPGHHGVHHQRPCLQFGLYFTYWDRLLSTQSDRF